MDDNCLFIERQRYNRWWLLVILVGVIGILGYSYGDHPKSDESLIIALVGALLIAIFLLSMKLKTQIRYDGIYVKYFPFHKNFKYIPWENLNKSFVKKYSPILEYGGWGIRWGFNKGQVYSISGNFGLQLESITGEKLLIGTNNPEEMIEVLERLGQTKV